MMKEFVCGEIDVIRVEWIDSNSWDGWHSVTQSLEWARTGVSKCESVGYLVYEDKTKIVLAMNLFFGKDNDPEIVANFGDLMTIPKFAIIKRELIYSNEKASNKKP